MKKLTLIVLGLVSLAGISTSHAEVISAESEFAPSGCNLKICFFESWQNYKRQVISVLNQKGYRVTEVAQTDIDHIFNYGSFHRKSDGFLGHYQKSDLRDSKGNIIFELSSSNEKPFHNTYKEIIRGLVDVPNCPQ